MEQEIQIESLKKQDVLFKFLKIDLAIDSHTKENTKIDRILNAIREVCKKEDLIEEVFEGNDNIEINFYEYCKERHLGKLQTQRNKLSRQIATLKKANLN